MKRPGSLYLVILLLALLLAMFHGLSYWSGVIDDAYISFRYAANLAAGEGLVFNPGERVEGFSNLLWTLGAALFLFLGADPMLAAKAAGLAATVLTLVVLDRLLARTVDSSIARLAGLALAVLSVPLAFWSVQGMEAPLFTLLLAAAFWRSGLELEQRRGFPWSALLLFLACLTRPEGPLYLLVVIGVRLAHGGRFRRCDLHWLLVFFIPLAAHQVWRFTYFGDLLPNTYYAKGSAGAGLFSPQAHAAGSTYLTSFLSAGWWLPVLFGALGLVAVVLAFIRWSDTGPERRSRLLLPLLWLGAALFFAWYANGDWMPHSRFLVPAVPALALLAAVGIDAFAVRIRGGVSVAVSGTLALALVTALVLEAGAIRPTALPTLSAAHRPRLLPMAMVLMETLRDGETVVYGDIGIVGYLNPGIRIIDNRGLVHRTMARLLFNRPHRMNEVNRLRRVFLEELFRVRPEAAVVVINQKARAPVWQTEIYALHPVFQHNYAEARRLTYRRKNTELLCLRRDLIKRTLDPEEVIGHYQRAIRLAPRIGELYIRLGEICEASGRLDVRRETLASAARRFAGDPEMLQRLEDAGR